MTNEHVPDWPVAYRVRRALDIAHIDADTLARELGCSRTTAYNYIAGRTRPKRADLKVVHELTAVPLWWLEGSPAPDGDTASVTHRYRPFRQEHLKIAA